MSRRKLEIKRRERILRLKRRRSPHHNFAARSPCAGCIGESRSKNSKWCKTCTAPRAYADAIANNGQADIPSVSCVDGECISRVEALQNFLTTVWEAP